jgi:hypothetical protein
MVFCLVICFPRITLRLKSKAASSMPWSFPGYYLVYRSNPVCLCAWLGVMSSITNPHNQADGRTDPGAEVVLDWGLRIWSYICLGLRVASYFGSGWPQRLCNKRLQLSRKDLGIKLQTYAYGRPVSPRRESRRCVRIAKPTFKGFYGIVES